MSFYAINLQQECVMDSTDFGAYLQEPTDKVGNICELCPQSIPIRSRIRKS